MKGRILFIDDDRAGRELARYNLGREGYEVDEAAAGKEGLARFSRATCDLVITDMRMPGLSGIDVLEEIKRRAPEVPVIVITAHGNVETAVQAMKLGAYDFIEKPFRRDLLSIVVRRALERRELLRQNRTLRRQASSVHRPIVACSQPMKEVLSLADRVADSEVSVLITGESGTGKELVARRIHVEGPRADGPFVAVNCAAMPAELLESELFGHAKGAYTGADRERAGRFRSADGGTLFLDEVVEMPLPLQSKLLRVLQERVVDVIGRDRAVPVNVRVLAATNQDPAARIATGEFREDLYYRLNAFEIAVPCLRDRPEDIPPLVEHFLGLAAAERELTIPPVLMEELCRRRWPGNVRELENVCERLVLLCKDGVLRLEDLPTSRDDPAAGREAASNAEPWPPLPPEGMSLIDLERQVIERVLRLKAGNVTQAAAYLRVPRHILAYRIAKYGIVRD